MVGAGTPLRRVALKKLDENQCRAPHSESCAVPRLHQLHCILSGFQVQRDTSNRVDEFVLDKRLKDTSAARWRSHTVQKPSPHPRRCASTRLRLQPVFTPALPVLRAQAVGHCSS